MINLTLESSKTFPMEGSADQLEIQSNFAKLAAANSMAFNPGADMAPTNTSDATLG